MQLPGVRGFRASRKQTRSLGIRLETKCRTYSKQVAGCVSSVGTSPCHRIGLTVFRDGAGKALSAKNKNETRTMEDGRRHYATNGIGEVVERAVSG